MQAVVHKCLPIVPDRLVYPEIYPAACRYESFPEDPEKEARAAVALILKMANKLKGKDVAIPEMSAFTTDRLVPIYEQAFRGTADS